LRSFAPGVFVGQYQQRPTPEKGETIQLDWFNRYKESPVDFDQVVLSLDTAYSKKDENDPSVCLIFGKYKNRWYLLQVWKRRVQYPELKRIVSTLCSKWNPHALLIENKASGLALVPDMLEQGHPAIPIQPEADKLTRMKPQSPHVEAGLIYLPEQAEWLADFEDECVHFPLGKHDDQVDALSQFLKWVHGNKSGFEVITSEELDKLGQQMREEDKQALQEIEDLLDDLYDDDDY
jgi:predicted phage terminase large subunit-like protein